MMKVPVLLLLVAVALCMNAGAAMTTSSAPPIFPPLDLDNLEYVATEINIPEGYAMDCHVALDKNAGAYASNCSSASGWSASYIRNDLGNLSALVMSINGETYCFTRSFSTALEVRPPNFWNFNYAQEAVFMGNAVHEQLQPLCLHVVDGCDECNQQLCEDVDVCVRGDGARCDVQVEGWRDHRRLLESPLCSSFTVSKRR